MVTMFCRGEVRLGVLSVGNEHIWVADAGPKLPCWLCLQFGSILQAGMVVAGGVVRLFCRKEDLVLLMCMLAYPHRPPELVGEFAMSRVRESRLRLCYGIVHFARTICQQVIGGMP